ncbi:MAG: pyrroloquinoline quinone precursor peptide PqqA [Cyanobacteria bacterium J06628_3]
MQKTNNSSTSGNKDTNISNTQTKKTHTNSSDSPGFKPAAVWEAPYAEEFGLCMEVTAYVHQLD